MNEKRRWPVKCGCVTVCIRLQRPTKDDPNYRCYTLDFTDDGRRMRPSFVTLKEAKKQAKKVAKRLSRGDTGTVVLNGNPRLKYSRALESLAPLGVSLDVAAADFARAAQILNGKGNLLDAAGCAVGLRGLGGDGAIVCRKQHHVRAEIRGRLAVPRGFVIGALGDGDARADHVELDLEAVVHGRRLCNARQAAKGENEGFCAENDWESAAGSRPTAAAAVRRA